MSHENVEIVRRAFGVWNAGNMDALRELFDPDIVWRAPEGWPEPGPYVGRESVMRQNRRDMDAFVALISPDVEWEDPAARSSGLLIAAMRSSFSVG
jgi:ketosteroid isomerase-like protein